MEHRLGRTLRVFLVVLASAGFYRLAVVPVVEPRVRDAAAALEMTPEEAAAIRARADRRMTAIGEVFAAGAWERDDPIVLESRQMRLLFKEYHSLPDGRVNLVPCTLVVFPDRSRPAGDASGGRTIVMRAPQGAVLEFDEPLDLRQGRLAKLVGGSLRGQVSIRGTPTGPDADDDIEIVTRDVELDELEVRTGEMVQFRYGRSSGSGRALVARLRPRQAASDQGPNIAGVDSIRLDRDVRMRLEGLRGGLLPGAGAEPAPADPTAAAPPVLVSCRGSLCMNVAANVVTLEDHVDVVRTLPGGGTDQLACDLLAILLARPDGRQEGTSGGLEPVEIQAKGAPVVVRSSAATLEARAARLGYEIATRRILLDGDEPVSLTVRGSEMEARKIDYCPGPPGDPGALMAVGPGWLRARSEDSPPTRARWQQWLRMRPDGAGHVVSIAGDAEVAVEGQGRMSGAEMHLWLDVLKDAATAPAAPAAGPDLSRIRPSRLLARGMVEAEAEQGTARTDRLEVWFRTIPAAAAPVAAATAQVAAAPAPAAAAPVAAPPAPRPAAPPAMPNRRAAAGNRVAATAGLVRGLVVLSGSGTHVEEMSMEGQVHLVEQVPPNAAAQGRGMEIRGDQLQLSRPQQPDARAIVSGRPACVDGRDLHIEGPLVEFDRGRNHMTVDGAGRLTLPLAAGGGGFESFGFSAPAASPPAADAAPGHLDVTWQGRLDFDGLTARFVDTVDANAGTTLVACGSLDVAFDRAFDFGAPSAAGPPPQVARVACGSRVRVESRSESEEGPAVEQLFARDLVIDRRTGDVTGTGPGRLTSTRHGQVADMAPPTTGLPGGVAQPVSAPKRAAGLTYLGVDFQRGLRGNLNRRIVEFHQRVEAIHGPVARWGDTLDAHAAGGLPRDAVAISSDVLAVIQTAPPAGRRRGSIDLAAGGNVLVEGEAFTARSARLTWSEAKDLLVFEGDGRADAQLFRQVKAGAQPDAMASEKILYWRGLNRVDVEGVRYLELDKLPGGAGRGMPAGGGPPPGLTPRPIPGT